MNFPSAEALDTELAAMCEAGAITTEEVPKLRGTRLSLPKSSRPSPRIGTAKSHERLAGQRERYLRRQGYNPDRF